jgi:hypothetical protein
VSDINDDDEFAASAAEPDEEPIADLGEAPAPDPQEAGE